MTSGPGGGNSHSLNKYECTKELGWEFSDVVEGIVIRKVGDVGRRRECGEMVEVRFGK